MELKNLKLFFLNALAIGFWAPGILLAWGMVGHETVALIAEDHLTKEAHQGVRDLLGPRQSLADVSTWADSIVDQRPETRPWHFFNLDARQVENPYDIADVCPNHNCVVDQIEKDLEILREPFSSRKDKREALSFLVHFVGDVHQPLHCADDNDRGGNEKWFRYFGPHGTSRHFIWVDLHGFWDNLIEPKAKDHPLQLASQLEKAIRSEDERDWVQGTPTDWAYESFLIARNDIYKELPEGKLLEKNRWGKNLPGDYYSGKMRLIVNRQLEKAGIRLAYLLNQLFSQN